MSGSISAGSAFDYSQLFAGAVTSDTPGASLLSALYGTAGAVGTAADGPGALAAYKADAANATSDIAATAAQPAVARDIAAFQAGVAAAKTPAALLANPAVLKVLLTANGLGDQIAYPGLAAKALLSNPADPSSLADQLSNTAWKAAATTFQFATAGLSVIQDPKVQATLTQAYAEVTWRNSLDAAHPGLSNALSFRGQVAGVTDIYAILGNSTLRDVVTTALDLPQQIAIQPLEAQAKAITSRLDLTKLADPKFVDGFLQQYLLNKASSAASTTTGASSLDSLAIASAGLVA